MPTIRENAANQTELHLLRRRLVAGETAERETKAIADGRARAELRRRIQEYLLIPKNLRRFYDDPREEAKAARRASVPESVPASKGGGVRIIRKGARRD
jgi:hypothetical protein